MLHLIKWNDKYGDKCEFRLVNFVCARWEDFGLFLDVPRNQLDAWKGQENSDAKKCWNRVMDDWLTRGGTSDYPVTWEGIFTLLEDVGFSKAIEDLKIALAGHSASLNS